MKKVLKAYLTICLSVLILCFIGCGISNQESMSSSQNHDYNNVSKNTNMITKPEGKESEKTKEENRDKEGKEESLKDNKNENKDVLNKDANNSNKKSDQAVDKNKKDNNTSKEVKKTSKTSKTSSSISQESNKKILDENQNKDKSENKKIENREDEDYFTFIVSKDMKGKISKKPQILLKKQIKISKDKNAMTYLRENCTVIENGGFIKSINGNHNLYPIPSSKKTEEQKKNKILGIDWFIYLNEKKSSVGVNDIIPIKGDILHLDIHEWDKSEFSF